MIMSLPLKDRPELKELIAEAQAKYNAMNPLERAIHDLQQRRSWVVGELMMNDDASPNGRTREECIKLVEQSDPAFVLLAEFERRGPATK